MLLTLEVALLALPIAIRPTSLAAIYAMLSREAPRRLMIAYTVAGLAFSISVGLIVVWAFHGVTVGAGSSSGRAIATIVGGCLVLALAFALAAGRIAWPPPGAGHDRTGRFKTTALLDRAVTPRTAALAGPATHLPGLFYLIALNLIVTYAPPVGQTLINVLVFNAVWFALPAGALAVCVVRPATAREGVAAVQQWTTRHLRSIVTAASFVVGALLVIRGLLAL